MSKSSDPPTVSLPKRMVISSFAGMGAAVCCHPLDVLRVQMQIDSEGGKPRFNGSVDAAVKISKQNGVRGLYTGLSAAFLRQWTYGSCRMGIYSFLLKKYNPQDGTPLPFLKKMAFGCMAGGIGAFCGTPSELSLVRMSADSKLPPEQRRNYKNVVDCCTRIFNEEGPKALWRGATVTILRAMSLASVALAVTSETKEQLYAKGYFSSKDSLPLMFTSTLVASLFANSASLPFDVVKSRVQNMPIVDGKPLYKSTLDCATKSLKAEGPLVFWKGFAPAFVKLAPYTVISLTLVDKLTFFVTGTSAM
mmetsp:Transcript_2300/g.3203  ORF Transcript_2300/g.3203 Transcript_2300/m.3203 type:complete len:306 (+) Transcript_2300:94-1011(+)